MLTLLQRCLIHLSQHDRVGRRDGRGYMQPSTFLIKEIRESMDPDELAACDKYDPEVEKEK